jgi:hypothetical protein
VCARAAWRWGQQRGAACGVWRRVAWLRAAVVAASSRLQRMHVPHGARHGATPHAHAHARRTAAHSRLRLARPLSGAAAAAAAAGDACAGKRVACSERSAACQHHAHTRTSTPQCVARARAQLARWRACAPPAHHTARISPCARQRTVSCRVRAALLLWRRGRTPCQPRPPRGGAAGAGERGVAAGAPQACRRAACRCMLLGSAQAPIPACLLRCGLCESRLLLCVDWRRRRTPVPRHVRVHSTLGTPIKQLREAVCGGGIDVVPHPAAARQHRQHKLQSVIVTLLRNCDCRAASHAHDRHAHASHSSSPTTPPRHHRHHHAMALAAQTRTLRASRAAAPARRAVRVAASSRVDQ